MFGVQHVVVPLGTKYYMLIVDFLGHKFPLQVAYLRGWEDWRGRERIRINDNDNTWATLYHECLEMSTRGGCTNYWLGEATCNVQFPTTHLVKMVCELLFCTPSVPKWLSYFSDKICSKMIVWLSARLEIETQSQIFLHQALCIKKFYDTTTSGGALE